MTERRVLVLASASPARLRLLRDAGLHPVVRVSDVDEDAAVEVHRSTLDPGSQLTPAEMGRVLARCKSSAVALALTGEAGFGSALVVGCDSVLELDGMAWGKPTTPNEAVDRWRRMRGTTGFLHTGHCLIDCASGVAHEGVASTAVTFADVTDREIDLYVSTGEPLQVAGAFTLDGLSAPFVDRIVGDPSNVVGLSLPLLRKLLRYHGVDLVDLWAT